METELQERQKKVAERPAGEMKITRTELSADIKNVLGNINENRFYQGEGFSAFIVGASQKANIQTKAEDPVMGIPRLIANANSAIEGLLEKEKIGEKVPKRIAQT